MSDEPFLARWSRRKTQIQEGKPVLEEPAVAPADAALPARQVGDGATAVESGTSGTASEAGATPAPGALERALPAAGRSAGNAAALPATAPLPTMADVAQLTRASDYSRFVAPGVDPTVSNAAMKKLFADPRFNVMDGLDTYIDDYGKPDPIPESMLRRMTQSKTLGLFEAEERPAASAVPGAADGAGDTDDPRHAAHGSGADSDVPPPVEGGAVSDAGPTADSGVVSDARPAADAGVVSDARPDAALAITDGTAAPRPPQSDTADAGGEPEDFLP